MRPHHRLLISLMPPLWLSWITLVIIDPDPDIAVGYFLGSLFAHVTLSAAWMGLGVGKWFVRLAAAVGWVWIVLCAIVINATHSHIPSNAVLVLCACLVVQWLVLQIPLWGLALGVGLRLMHRKVATGESYLAAVQFGIRHLLIIMGIVGLALGIGRVTLPLFVLEDHEGPLLLFLALAAIVMTLPVLLAALMRRMALLGVPLSLLLVGLATVGEMPLLGQFNVYGPDMPIVIAINAASAAMTLLIAAIVRVNGYCLYTGTRSKSSAA